MLRLGWSPDGHYIVSAHAMNNSGPTAQIIKRDGWKTSIDFVGHRKAVTVVVGIRTSVSTNRTPTKCMYEVIQHYIDGEIMICNKELWSVTLLIIQMI